MNYKVRGQHIEVTDALLDYVEKKLGRLERYFEAPPTSDVNVTLSVIRDLHIVEVTIPLPGLLLRAEDRSKDMYASIDSVTDKLERQIRKHKTKVNRKFRQTGTDASLFSDAATPVPVDEEDQLEVVRTKRFTLKPMDVEEAILQMNMIGHSFFVFSNAETKEVNVVYRRTDGRYGLIEQG
ncbi:ribosome-associated translation inhibitor RaiA [Paenibacillus melissococcoides]|uniref:Ribosome hibernation promoting factor n=1 Tax=Paenibacillus melissococcoides TaxID=2912268 RepID=A0ABM9GAZ3_9BACL|nr:MULTISPECIES: ribosome-associated translation inhibitor RaiA [Paenibacillus]MEB9894640.1 ribosome-associated translation inhibitor RaiA [Bacillus cereus]CAH8248902.1 ribosome-associated translation inhibitor RaiA [Paenibacillus melissococcoides]CAH8720738.1 ribosome-associated translation inhibitor RaiA [Paenibacillus melissococcoides]CAH8720911.1 ribosome-associated translation inhibitor RaiA [Paenibacillus melissococcoides]GIO79234.1 ribosomal subunit interface protein [Paenibacillus dend